MFNQARRAFQSTKLVLDLHSLFLVFAYNHLSKKIDLFQTSLFYLNNDVFVCFVFPVSERKTLNFVYFNIDELLRKVFNRPHLELSNIAEN